ncbi:transglutaminase TgpA family protein [Gimesia algae]|uniref:Protein-glutamine gamma-glutamyltransferase n=1 Tax=Gimesia algae TaxID=2527971 RepID=A0A517V7C7_9PLAN|nr:transglutaminaseTgpA domain-containing protein [Gimesia algae]QDT88910.1 Protein-glutamine gamma-glutamyltransferase [Gimesia algae]
MNLTLTFQISIYLLVVLSSIMFMMAEGGVIPQIVTIPLGLITLFFTDRWNKFSLSPLWANILGLLAFLVVCAEFSSTIEGRLLSGAHFLVYLTWIILLQKKGDTQYWWLCTLGFLQIAVGAVLTESVYYGLLLVIYLYLSIWTLSVFSLHRTRNSFLQYDSSSPFPKSSTVGQSPGYSLSNQKSCVRGGIQSDLSRQWLSVEYLGACFGYFISALLISMCFFLLIPRLWVNRSFFENEALAASDKPLVGFAEKVQLGEMGEILESSERVLQLSIYDNQTDEPVPVSDFVARFGTDEPLFRGAVLSGYENGSWSKIRRRSRWRLYNSEEIEKDLKIKQLYRQELVLDSIGTEVLFIMQPFVGMDMMSRTEYSINLETLEIRQAQPPEADGETRYNVFTAKEQSENVVMDELDNEAHYLKLPEDDLKRLISFTKKLIADNPQLKTNLEKARFIESYLRDSGDFSYTLNMSIQDPDIDPVEDFLFNRKSGHCEYYATALALMLRSIEIPTRVISGFKGGEQGYLSNQFEVQQRYAHSWVEAFLDDRWQTLDATPSLQRAESVAQNATSLGSWKGISNTLTNFWSDYVIGVSFQRQKSAFYDPMLRAGKRLGNRLYDLRATVVSLLKSIKAFLSSPRRWFSWEGGAAVFIIAGLIFGFKWLFGVLIRLLRKLLHRQGEQTRQLRAGNVAFYEKFQDLLANRGLVRNPVETQKEFTTHVKSDLRSELSQAHLDETPDLFTQLFYQVRYGGHPLNPEQSEELRQKLAELEIALTQGERTEDQKV